MEDPGKRGFKVGNSFELSTSMDDSGIVNGTVEC